MNKILDYIKRNSLWFLLGTSALLVLRPAIQEINTLLICIIIESLSLALSGLAVFVFTKIDFLHDDRSHNLGLIFLGVHLCVGFVVLGVYIAQFSV